MHRSVGMAALGLLIGCGGAASAPVATPHAAATQAPTTSGPDSTATAPRIAGTTFGSLVRAAQALPGDTPHAELGCLLNMRDGHAELGVGPLSALSTLPDAPDTLGPLPATSTSHVRVLTRWGQRGLDPFDVVLATWTPLPPSALADAAVALLITRAGIVVRETNAPVAIEASMSRDDAALWLLERTSLGPITVVISADAEIDISEVHALLKALPSSIRHVALAVALSPDTHLPSTAPRAPDARSHCPDGLPEPPEGAPEGELPSASIVRSLSVIHEPLQRCLANTNGPGVIGGKVTLALRIADTGNVSHTCLYEDAIGDNVLAACLIETARTATFSRPAPIGFVDVHIPLSLAPVFEAAPRPICE